MLALTATTHGQDPTPILIALGALGVAIFWKVALRVALALLLILIAYLLIHVVHDETAFVTSLRQAVG